MDIDSAFKVAKAANLTKRQYEMRMACEERFEAWRKLLPSPKLHPNRQVTVMTPVGMATYIYCINCGRPGGAVTNDLPDVCYLCDACAATHGGLPVPEIPEAFVRPSSQKEK